MRSVREHVDRLHGSHLIFLVHELQVACLGSRVTAHIHYAVGVGAKNGVNHVGVHASAWRVCYDHVGLSMLSNELVGEYVLHVASIELRVTYAVDVRVYLRVLNSLRHIFYAHHLTRVASHEVGNGARSRVEVVDHLVACELCKLACHAVEVVSLVGVCLVEALRSHLEAQPLHCFKDVVVALEHGEVEVAERVVAFLVVDIEQRCDLWKLVGDVLHETQGTFVVALLVIVELHEHHPLARVRVADHDVAKQTVLLAQVEEGHAGVEGIVAYGVAYAVVEVVHEPTFLYRQNLVESSRDVEANAVHVVVDRSCRHLLACEPALVAASKLELVTILASLHAAHDGSELGQLNLAYACELVMHLLLLGFELLLVRQVLPLAASAHAKMLTHRLCALLALFYKTYNLCLAVMVFFLAHLQVHHVAGHGEGHEHHHVVHPCERFAFGGNVFYCDVLQYG